MRLGMRLFLIACLAISSAFGFSFTRNTESTATILVADLPRVAQQTLTLIKTGGPFPYTRDGIVFGNYEKRLPLQPRGYYSEYTVKTPGRRDRGPRRIIAGERSEYFYTEDHYKTFRRIRE